METRITPLEIEAFVATHNNPAGLNTLIWSILLGEVKPGFLTILNTGGSLDDYQLIQTLNFAAREMKVTFRNIPNETFLVGGEFHFGLFRKTWFELASKDVVWLLEDDVVLTPSCLARQLCHALPNLPRDVDPSNVVNEVTEPEFHAYHYAGKPTQIRKGCMFGLLARLEDLRAVPDLDRVAGHDDSWIVAHLRPTVIPDVVCYHTRPSRMHFSQFGSIIESFLTGRLVPPRGE